MSTEGDQPSRAELIAQAGELRTGRGLSTRAIAAEMGIPHSTARDYIKLAEQHTEWIDLFDRAEMSQALGLQGMEILSRVKRAIDATDDDDAERLVKLSGAWTKGAGQLAQLFGLNAPTRVQTEMVNRPSSVEMNPEIVAAVRNAQTEAARRRAEIRGEAAAENYENGEQ